MKPPSPLLGFNNNVRHKGRVFHIQTEDSGVRHPHIITHLFADGGRILKTTKTSYAEFIDAANMGEVVRQMMQEQHKAMFIALRGGQFDHLVDELPQARASSPGQTSSRLAPQVTTSGAPAATSAAPASTSLASTGPLSVRDVREVLQPALSSTPESVREPPPSLGTLAANLTFPGRATAPAAPTPISHAPTLPSVPATKPRGAPEPPALPTPPATRERLPSAPVPPLVNVPAAPPIAILPSAPPLAGPPIAPPPPHPLGAAPAHRPLRRPGSVPPPPPHPPAALVSRPTPARVTSTRPRLNIDPAAIHRAPDPEHPAHAGTLASVVEATVEGGTGIDLDTLERAAAEAETPLFQQIRDLPPPPAALMGSRQPAESPGGYSSVTPTVTPAVTPPLSPSSSAPPSNRGRYAPSRPSSIFAAVRPQEGASIFGEDLISEKSLDEVILSYLAEDLEGPGEKK